MKRFALLLIVALAMAVGYLLGTEQGRAQRDQILEAINKKRGQLPLDEVDLTSVADAAQDAAETAAEAVTA